jgi:formylglycine-generating enzyme required for sulfatase activity
VGLRELNGNSYLWVDEAKIKSESFPADVLGLERVENGPAFVRPQSLRKSDGKLIPATDSAFEDAFQAEVAAAAVVREKLVEITRHRIGDINGDRMVNGADISAVLSLWGPDPTLPAADISGDGIVNGVDLAMLLSNWGPCPQATVPSWATLIEALPNPAVVTDAALRQRIASTNLAWRVRDRSSNAEMLLVPPGTFQMGCSPTNLSGCNSEENPVHSVTLTSPFYIGRYELTQAQWAVVMGSNPSRYQGLSDSASRPVEQVTWTMAQSFLNSTGLRLPTEAEWEYACRAGTSTAYNNGSNDESTVGQIAWYGSCCGGNSGTQSHAVGGRTPNALGIYDMSGNVWEWVNDYYGATYYSSFPNTNPPGPGSGTTRVLRGGSFKHSAGSQRSSLRIAYPTYYTFDDFGIRVARNP